jgi:hypothetical protein
MPNAKGSTSPVTENALTTIRFYSLGVGLLSSRASQPAHPHTRFLLRTTNWTSKFACWSFFAFKTWLYGYYAVNFARCRIRDACALSQVQKRGML